MLPMSTIRITAKRQATFPKALCEEMGVGPGDVLRLERLTVGDETVWVLRPDRPDWSWLGAAQPWAAGKDHDWEAVDSSIRRALGSKP